VRNAQARGAALARTRQFEWLARGGLVARGVVYGVIGLLAIKLALGDGGGTTNQQGALRTIAGQPFGKALLILTAVGLAGYALWRLSRAAIGHGREQTDSTSDRIAAGASGVAYTLLCVTAVKILLGAGTGGSGNPKHATGGVLGWTGGRELVAVAGAIFIGVAVYQGYKGASKSFLDDSRTGEMSPHGKRVYTAFGMFGHLARMVVFGLVGYGLIKAAVDYNSQKAVGLDGALAKLAQNSYGPFVLGVVAAGLIGFGLYSIADARYRRI